MVLTSRGFWSTFSISIGRTYSRIRSWSSSSRPSSKRLATPWYLLNKTLFLIWMYQCFFIFFGVKLIVNSLQLSFTFVECSNYLSFLFCRVYRSILWQSSTSGRRRPRTGTSTSSSTTKDWAPRRLRRPRSVSAKCSVIESSSKASLLR